MGVLQADVAGGGKAGFLPLPMKILAVEPGVPVPGHCPREGQGLNPGGRIKDRASLHHVLGPREAAGAQRHWCSPAFARVTLW